MSTKRWAYQVTHSTYPQVKIGSVLIYKQSRGPSHSEVAFNWKTVQEAGYFEMEKIGPCWVVDGKIQFEEPPAKSGTFTKGIMSAVRKRARELKRSARETAKANLTP